MLSHRTHSSTTLIYIAHKFPFNLELKSINHRHNGISKNSTHIFTCPSQSHPIPGTVHKHHPHVNHLWPTNYYLADPINFGSSDFTMPSMSHASGDHFIQHPLNDKCTCDHLLSPPFIQIQFIHRHRPKPPFQK